jgi:hypothetical protein
MTTRAVFKSYQPQTMDDRTRSAAYMSAARRERSRERAQHYGRSRERASHRDRADSDGRSQERAGHRRNRGEERGADERRSRAPRFAVAATQTLSPPVTVDAAAQTATDNPGSLLTQVRGLAREMARKLSAGEALGPAGVATKCPDMTLLEAECLIVAVGEGLSAGIRGPPAASRASPAPPSASADVCLIAVNDQPGLSPPLSAMGPPVSTPPSRGQSLTAVTVATAVRRVRRQQRHPELPAGAAPTDRDRYLSLIFQGKDEEARQLRDSFV